MQISKELRVGDVVEVLPAAQILDTLDADGALAGMPFMPEMFEFCGVQALVSAGAGKTCVEVAPGDIPIREFLNNDVVFLENLRCSGAKHGNCRRDCLLFWKQAWLRKVDPRSAMEERSNSKSEVPAEMEARLKTQTDDGLYVCQSTRLEAGTQHMEARRKLFYCWREVRSGDCGPLEMLGLMLKPIWAKFFRLFWNNIPKGPNKRTPSESLNLQPGEWVEVKSLEEIIATLDSKGRNRGLQADKLISPWCGKRFKVHKSMDRMIIESTGKMRELQNTVMLKGPQCRCHFVIGGCGRAEPMYWREIWLKRVSSSDETA